MNAVVMAMDALSEKEEQQQILLRPIKMHNKGKLRMHCLFLNGFENCWYVCAILAKTARL